jgi:hypothetical protein
MGRAFSQQERAVAERRRVSSGAESIVEPFPPVERLIGVLRSLLACLVALIAACGDLSSGQAGALASASPAAVATSQPLDCLALGQLPTAPAPPLAVADLGDGTQRVTSAYGGYSLIAPKAWSVTGSFAGGIEPLYGQAHLASFDRQKVQTPRPEAGYMLPPEVGINLDIEVWQNTLREPLDRYAMGVSIGPDQVGVVPGGPVTIDGRPAYRLTIQDERRFQPTNAPLITTRQTRAVWLVPTTRDDRLIVVAATPAESSLFGLAERAVATLRVTAPVPSTKPVTVQRSEIVKQWTIGPGGAQIAGRRVAAKLMTYAEASAAMNGPHTADANAPHAIGNPRIDHDPDDLYWLVAVSGPDLPQGRGGGPGAASSPAPTAWILYDTSATGGTSSGTGAQYAGASAASGTWPLGFDSLPDRCR